MDLNLAKHPHGVVEFNQTIDQHVRRTVLHEKVGLDVAAAGLHSKRRTNPLLVQQEREFNQLIELQASTGRLQTKLEEVQAKREDVRERLLEARHVVSMLEIEERQLSISVEEVESDLKKIKGYQEGLARLVSTRYDDDEYEKAVIKIQTKWRGRRDWQNGKKMKVILEFT